MLRFRYRTPFGIPVTSEDASPWAERVPPLATGR